MHNELFCDEPYHQYVNHELEMVTISMMVKRM